MSCLSAGANSKRSGRCTSAITQTTVRTGKTATAHTRVDVVFYAFCHTLPFTSKQTRSYRAAQASPSTTFHESMLARRHTGMRLPALTSLQVAICGQREASRHLHTHPVGHIESLAFTHTQDDSPMFAELRVEVETKGQAVPSAPRHAPPYPLICAQMTKLTCTCEHICHHLFTCMHWLIQPAARNPPPLHVRDHATFGALDAATKHANTFRSPPAAVDALVNTLPFVTNHVCCFAMLHQQRDVTAEARFHPPSDVSA